MKRICSSTKPLPLLVALVAVLLVPSAVIYAMVNNHFDRLILLARLGPEL